MIAQMIWWGVGGIAAWLLTYLAGIAGMVLLAGDSHWGGALAMFLALVFRVAFFICIAGLVITAAIFIFRQVAYAG